MRIIYRERYSFFFLFSSIFVAIFIVFNGNLNKRYSNEEAERRIVFFLLRGKKFETKKNVKFYCWQRSIRRTVIFLDLLSLPSDFNFLWASRNRRDLDPLRVKRGEMA